MAAISSWIEFQGADFFTLNQRNNARSDFGPLRVGKIRPLYAAFEISGELGTPLIMMADNPVRGLFKDRIVRSEKRNDFRRLQGAAFHLVERDQGGSAGERPRVG